MIRICFSILPLIATLATLLVTLVVFFGSFNNKLTSVYLMSIDLSSVSVSGVSISSDLSDVGLYEYYQVGVNAYCYGSNSTTLEGCSTPTHPYWFNLTSILSNSTVGAELVTKLPSEISEYQKIVEAASYAMWSCFVAVMVLCGVVFVFGVLSLCSPIMGCCVSIFSGLAFFLSLVGAGIATGLFKVYTSKFTSTLDSFGAQADMGNQGIILVWVAVGCALLAEVLWSLTSCCCFPSMRSSRQPRVVEETPAVYDTGYVPVYNHTAPPPQPAANMYYREEESAYEPEYTHEYTHSTPYGQTQYGQTPYGQKHY